LNLPALRPISLLVSYRRAADFLRLAQYDRKVYGIVKDKVKTKTNVKVRLSSRPAGTHGGLLTSTRQGKLKTYRLCDEVWTFIVKDAQFKMEQNELVHAAKVKIIACKNPDAEADKAKGR
jgi:hypothetical protein